MLCFGSYDSRFRGYGKNKIVHLMLLDALRWTFMVHPSGFLVHRWHERTAVRDVHQRMHVRGEDRAGPDTLVGHMAALFLNVSAGGGKDGGG